MVSQSTDHVDSGPSVGSALRGEHAPGQEIGTKRSHRRQLVALGVVLIVILAGWRLLSSASASGDPGGAILSQLTPAATALPGYGTRALPWSAQPSTSGPYLIKREPMKDSCDGMAGTEGWSEVVVQGAFTWPGSPVALFDRVGSGLSALGWRRKTVRADGHQAMWTKTLESGSTATADLSSSPLGDPDWEFDVTAAPVGRAASGC
jgi:hypothetical protein